MKRKGSIVVNLEDLCNPNDRELCDKRNLNLAMLCNQCFGIKIPISPAQKELACRCLAMLRLSDFDNVSTICNDVEDDVDSGIGESPPMTPSTPLTPKFQSNGSSEDVFESLKWPHVETLQSKAESCVVPTAIPAMSSSTVPTSTMVKSPASSRLTVTSEKKGLFSRLRSLAPARSAPTSPVPAIRSSQQPTRKPIVDNEEHHSRFYQRLVKWLKSKTTSKNRVRRHSTEIHCKSKYRISQPPSNVNFRLLEEPSPRHHFFHYYRHQYHPFHHYPNPCNNRNHSLADVTTIAEALAMARRRSSDNSSRNLAPPPTTMSSSRDCSMESGYHSSHASLSTPTTPKNQNSTHRFRQVGNTAAHIRSAKDRQHHPASLKWSNKSVSVDASCTLSPPSGVRSQARSFMNWRSEDQSSVDIPAATSAQERRRLFRQKPASVFREVNEVSQETQSEMTSLDTQQDLTVEAIEKSLGEWRIPDDELTLGKRIVDGGQFGHDVFAGKWHGDVVVHKFRPESSEDIRNYVCNIRKLTQIRHENIVLYMGASLVDNCAFYNIVTNPVKSASLFTRLRQMNHPALDVDYLVSLAKQLSNAIGYLHAKDIVHGRISSKNVFLESKVQLSLLDYAVGSPNTVYTSPQVLSSTNVASLAKKIFVGRNKGDDIFAFGTLLFELFSGQLPFADENEQVIEAKIRSGSLPRCLASLQCTDRLKKLIQRCWDYEASRRPTFAQMVPHFLPGSCLLRRHSTSEPRLDQINGKK